MKNLSILFIAFLLLQFIMLAQAPDALWTKTYGGSGQDTGNSVEQTTDGGYIICGSSSSFGAGSRDVYLIKTDALGDTVWTKTYGGSNDDYGYSVQQTADGGYIITGETRTFGAGNSDVWLIKTDALGDTLWTKTFGGSGVDWGNSVQQASDGGYIIAGHTSSFGAGESNVWIIKTDVSGNTIWDKTYGGTEGDVGNCVQQTSDGGYIITGITSFFGNYDLWLIKTDSSGDTLWTKVFDSNNWDYGSSVKQTNDEGYIITGFFGSGSNVWLIKTDSSGDTLWTKTFGGSDGDAGQSVQQTNDGGYVIVGHTSSFNMGESDVWIIKTDSSGDTLWTKTIGGIDIDMGKSIQQTTDGGYIVCGLTKSFGAGERDVWLIKLEPDSPSVIKSYDDLIPSNYSISQNFPNPFNPTTIIKYQIPELSFVTLKVYDVLGREIISLVNEEKSIGNYEVEFNATSLSSGVYFYKLQAGSFVETKKMVLMK